MSMLLILKEGRLLTIDSKSDIEPSYEIVDNQTVASGGFGISLLGVTPYAMEVDRPA